MYQLVYQFVYEKYRVDRGDRHKPSAGPGGMADRATVFVDMLLNYKALHARVHNRDGEQDTTYRNWAALCAGELGDDIFLDVFKLTYALEDFCGRMLRQVAPLAFFEVQSIKGIVDKMLVLQLRHSQHTITTRLRGGGPDTSTQVALTRMLVDLAEISIGDNLHTVYMILREVADTITVVGSVVYRAELQRTTSHVARVLMKMLAWKNLL